MHTLDSYKGKKVFLTGHSGFKGSWLALWLLKLGATVKGYSLEPNTDPSHFKLLSLDYESEFGDIKDYDNLKRSLVDFKPDIVFHLAAQPLVRYSYKFPRETYETNVMGTLNVLEAGREADVKAIVNVTTDKCYENKEWVWGYRENEPMGGYDPYSSSKGCSELLTSSYRNSYFNINTFGKNHCTLLASARAGNVIGGGDWAEDRLLPDIIRASIIGESVSIRSPLATRPWQHVLEPLSGYLLLGESLLRADVQSASGWNFGPSEDSLKTVEEVANISKKNWDKIKISLNQDNELHEANLLMLDSSKARTFLKWKPIWNAETAIEKTIEWYKSFYQENKMLSEKQLDEFVNRMMGNS